ncbi:MAG: ATP-binding cassette domain-containing protein [Chloroflexota bacterium]
MTAQIEDRSEDQAAAAVSEDRGTPVIEARKVSKHFGHLTALKDVDLKLWPGEVLGVVGDNGAGKSTLMKILSGMHPPSAGELLIEGRPVRLGSPGQARKLGIEMVYQDLALAGNMRIDENIYLGREPTRAWGPLQFVDHKANKERAIAHLDSLNIHVKSVGQQVENLSGGQRQAVAIARATAFDARVVIMDEPTAALAVREVGKVLDTIKDLRTHGISVILISHRLDDIFYVCDRVMSLYHGRNFAEAPLDQIERNDVIGWIMGNKTGRDVPAHLDRK